MKKTLILPILFLFILLTTSFASAIGEQRMLWAAGDLHVRVPGIWSRDGEYYYQMVNDTNNNITGIDIHFSVGDNVDYSNETNWNLFGTIFNTINARVYKNFTWGNHEQNGPAVRSFPENAYMQNNYTFEYGNIIFIGVSDDEIGHIFGSNIYLMSYPAVNATVQANQDKNIIIFTHHPLENTTNNSWGGFDVMNRTYNGEDYLWLIKNYNVAMWISAHNHLPGNYTKTTQYIYGTLFANVGSANLAIDGNTASDYLANWGGSTKQIDSMFVNFTKGSKQISIQRRNHNTSAWYTDQYLNITPDDQWINGSWLDYEFTTGNTTSSSGPTPGNNSINVPVAMKTISVNISSDRNDTMNWTIQLSNGNSSFGNLTTNTTAVCYVNLSSGTNYTMWVNTTDDDITWKSDVYYFQSGGFNRFLETTVHKSTFDEVSTGNSVLSIIGVILIIGAILAIIGIVYFFKR